MAAGAAMVVEVVRVGGGGVLESIHGHLVLIDVGGSELVGHELRMRT